MGTMRHVRRADIWTNAWLRWPARAPPNGISHRSVQPFLQRSHVWTKHRQTHRPRYFNTCVEIAEITCI